MTAVDAWLQLPDLTLDDISAVGISPRAVIRSGGIKVAKVRFHNERRLGKWFEFDADGSTTVILRCEQYDNLVDLVAIDVGTGQFARLHRVAWCLGDPAVVLSPNRMGDVPDKLPPVRTFRDPISWLESDCDGLVVLDAARARKELWNVGELAAQDELLGRQLKKLMRPPPWPGRVLVPRRAAA